MAVNDGEDGAGKSSVCARTTGHARMAHRMGAALRTALMIALLAGTAWSQFLPPLEADTPEEFDDYLTVESAVEPKAVLAATHAFRKRWPKSAMLPRIYELEFEAWRQAGDLAQARSAAEAALVLAPANLQMKAELAALVSSADPAYAERLAREALTGLEGFRVPKRITPDAWERLSGRIRSQAHMALGVGGIQMRRNSFSECWSREIRSLYRLRGRNSKT
jgi:hypothetical protein